MRINKILVLFIFLISLLAITVASQINQLAPNISLEEKETCHIAYNNNTQYIYSSCNYYHNYTYCSNISGQNTGCSLQQKVKNFSCQTGEQIVTNNEKICNPNKEFIITINQNNAIFKKQIDFSDWGACVYNAENNCLIVTCVSNEDGAFQGKFTDCNGGKSCQKFQICDNSIKVFYKNSREGFVADDPTFYLSQLALKEVAK